MREQPRERLAHAEPAVVRHGPGEEAGVKQMQDPRARSRQHTDRPVASGRPVLFTGSLGGCSVKRAKYQELSTKVSQRVGLAASLSRRKMDSP